MGLHGLKDKIDPHPAENSSLCFYSVEQADLTLVVVDCSHLPTDTQQAAAFLQGHLSTVLSSQEHPEMGEFSQLGI